VVALAGQVGRFLHGCALGAAIRIPSFHLTIARWVGAGFSFLAHGVFLPETVNEKPSFGSRELITSCASRLYQVHPTNPDPPIIFSADTSASFGRKLQRRIETASLSRPSSPSPPIVISYPDFVPTLANTPPRIESQPALAFSQQPIELENSRHQP
jgi:hypothetical protein